MIGITGRFRVAVLSFVLAVLGGGDRVPRVGGSVVGEPGIASVFPHQVVVEGLDVVVVDVSARHQKTGAVGAGIAATTQQVLAALPQLVESDGAAEARVEPGATVGVLLEPAEELLGGVKSQPLVSGTAQNSCLIPRLVLVERGLTVGQ